MLFSRPPGSLSGEEKKALEDFMFNWIIEKSIPLGLPIQIHTGYLAGNGNILEQSRPILLNNLFLKYPRARFVLFHGGYPWTGEYAALGKMFANVYLDLVWLPQISREAAVRGLDEMLDTVPYNKFFWGGDCHFIEESAGSLIFGKDVIAQVLAMRVERGLMTEDLAREVASGIFRANAISFFKLKL
jgi:predicted TIM-barrel fold metal-dependent hydrolase